MRAALAASVALAAALVVLPLAGQSDGHHRESPRHHATADSHVARSNEVMLFVGDTRKGGHDAFTIGLDVMRSVGHHWGVGVFLDHARAEFEREYIVGAGVFVAPFPGASNLHLFLGGGWERLDEDHAGPHGDGQVAVAHAWDNEDVAIARAGASWAIHLDPGGRWVFAPQAFYDVVSGHGRNAWVLGAGVGYGF